MKSPRIGPLFASVTLVLCCGTSAATTPLQPFSHVYSVRAEVKGKLVVTTRWQDALERTTVDGKPAFRRTQISTQSNGKTRTWVSVFDPGLAPIADTFSTSDGDLFARVFVASLVTDYSSSGSTRGVLVGQTTRLPDGYSDFNGGQFGLALLQLPLAPNYRTTLTTFGTTDARLQAVPIEVLRTETLHYGAHAGCTADVFVVRATFAARYYPDEGENYMTFWLAKAPPYVARLVLDTPGSGTVVTFDIDSSGGEPC